MLSQISHVQGRRTCSSNIVRILRFVKQSMTPIFGGFLAFRKCLSTILLTISFQFGSILETDIAKLNNWNKSNKIRTCKSIRDTWRLRPPCPSILTSGTASLFVRIVYSILISAAHLLDFRQVEKLFWNLFHSKIYMKTLVCAQLLIPFHFAKSLFWSYNSISILRLQAKWLQDQQWNTFAIISNSFFLCQKCPNIHKTDSFTKLHKSSDHFQD